MRRWPSIAGQFASGLSVLRAPVPLKLSKVVNSSRFRLEAAASGDIVVLYRPGLVERRAVFLYLTAGAPVEGRREGVQ